MSRSNLSESLEDYLEAIFNIVGEKQAARPKDIADRLGVTSASVTGALHALGRKSLIHHAPYDIVTLTAEGEALAQGVARRHKALKDFFVRVLGVGDKEAGECACRMEHAMPDSILQRFLQFLDSVGGDSPAALRRGRCTGRARGARRKAG